MKSLENFLNRVICGDCNEVMDQFPADCIDLIITSPPYNVGMEYETVMPLDQYMAFMEKVLVKCYDVLVLSGRIYINDIVLDPICGLGTTCIVAKKTNRRYIGIDNIEDYCKLAEKRLALT